MANSFRSFVFKMRFNKSAIAEVPHEEQLERIHRYLGALGQLHPLLGKWYLQGASVQDALRSDVLSAPKRCPRLPPQVSTPSIQHGCP
ncbi:hypothetical protein [Bowmanella yangjiangensis]|uniref:Uncharacterized protein n=1 Tax=Bowmanella yangjiangensis TaxID=2811230 RepID=A0ABS3D348_9ALTE|nr:hypothetical protein [Bowmanella yangjiangensis]MBN7823076.1 hypothetical protein [Bowmanella yangjiangensis]